MCGRFSLSGDVDFYAEYFGVDHVLTESLDRSWNVAPTDPVYVVAEREEARNLGTMRWGLIPHWAGVDQDSQHQRPDRDGRDHPGLSRLVHEETLSHPRRRFLRVGTRRERAETPTGFSGQTGIRLVLPGCGRPGRTRPTTSGPAAAQSSLPPQRGSSPGSTTGCRSRSFPRSGRHGLIAM